MEPQHTFDQVHEQYYGIRKMKERFATFMQFAEYPNSLLPLPNVTLFQSVDC